MTKDRIDPYLCESYEELMSIGYRNHLRELLDGLNWPHEGLFTNEELEDEYARAKSNREHCIGEHCSCLGPGWECTEYRED